MKKTNKRKFLRDQTQKIVNNSLRAMDHDALDPYWTQRIRQKKQLQAHLKRFNGSLIPGKLVSISEPMYIDLTIYCPEALLLIHDLGYNIQFKFDKL